MKKIYLYLLLLLTVAVKSRAQTGRAFNLNNLSQIDTTLSGWVFHEGDDKQWANPAYDDSKWQPADPGQDIRSFTPLRKTGIGWIRLHIRADSAITNRQLAAWISQYTASEVYLNGGEILKYGTVSADPSKVVGYLPSREPFLIRFNPNTDNVIAVRLAYQPWVPYESNFYAPLPAFSISVNSYQAALVNYRAYRRQLTWFIIYYTFSGAALFIVSFIHLVFFLFDRRQKVNLYYFLFCILLSYNAFPNEIWGLERFGPVAAQMWAYFSGGAIMVPAILLLLITIYSLFGYGRRFVFYIFVAIGVIFIGIQYFFGTIGFILTAAAFPVICLVEGVYVCVWAVRQQKKYAVFVLAGVSLFLVLTFVASVLDQATILSQLLYELSLISFPIGMSFYLGVQSSITNRRLVASLAEVQTLSEQKQQILASQNEILENQVNERTAELNTSLMELKQTQNQLIQSAKMASLGELTAGIAHEIQNPLNFVNNFSEVSAELIDEMQTELKAGDKDEAIAISEDIKQNLEKIRHHGQRADGIVKGMLEHSRTSTGQKEPTDLNKLADEYLRLAYHGLKAKDADFNAGLITNFDEKLPSVNFIPQDIGRVLVNLFNNAFYAVSHKAKTGGPGYKPTVEVSTSAEGGQVVISVKDNGNGIPENIKDKIMQPFFTTKPTGEGTGLGLSLSYDIVVKGHGGSIILTTNEGEYTMFTVSLPV